MRNYLKLSNGCREVIWFFDDQDPRTYLGLVARAKQAGGHLTAPPIGKNHSISGTVNLSVWRHCPMSKDLPCIGFCEKCAPPPRLQVVA